MIEKECGHSSHGGMSHGMGHSHGLPAVHSGVMNSSYGGNTTDEESMMVQEGISGHIESSLVWFIVGASYIALALRRHYVWKSMGKKYVSSVEFPLDFLPGIFKDLPAIAIFKIIGAGVFLSIEVIASIIREPGCIYTPVWQHETMACVFLLSGVVDIIMLNPRVRLLLPSGTDYLMFVLTFGIQVQQFVFHLEGRTPLSARLHGLLAVLAFGCVVSLVLEARYRSHVMMAVIRGYFIMAQGTWMMNLMFILYHPGHKEMTWDVQSHEDVGLASLMFIYHLVINMMLVMALNLLFVKLYGRQQYKFLPRGDMLGEDGKLQRLAMKKLSSNGHSHNGKTYRDDVHVNLLDDVDGDNDINDAGAHHKIALNDVKFA